MQSPQHRVPLTEIEQYLQEPEIVEAVEGQLTDTTNISTQNVVYNFNLLEYWENNQKKIPYSFQNGKTFSWYSCESAPIERVFSISTRVVTNSRTNLKPNSIEQIMMLKVNGFN